jgi:hypothetical protein
MAQRWVWKYPTCKNVAWQQISGKRFTQLTILLYEQGVLTADTAIERLKVQELYDQISFNTEKALQNLKFREIINIENK